MKILVLLLAILPLRAQSVWVGPQIDGRHPGITFGGRDAHGRFATTFEAGKFNGYSYGFLTPSLRVYKGLEIGGGIQYFKSSRFKGGYQFDVAYSYRNATVVVRCEFPQRINAVRVIYRVPLANSWFVRLHADKRFTNDGFSVVTAIGRNF